MFSLRCDYRENRGGCVISTLQQLRSLGAVVPADKYELRDEVMTTGDYAIQFSGYVILIERKTWEDLSASIKDGRISRNHQKMLDARDLGYRIMYLIEGKAPNPDLATTRVSGIPYANMMAKLDHFAMRDGVWIEYTRNSSHTAQRLLEIGKNMLTLQRRDCTTGSQSANTSEHHVGSEESKSEDSSATQVGRNLHVDTSQSPASGGLIRIINNPDEIIKKKYEKSVAEIRAAMLGCIPGIGPKTAATLLSGHSFPDIVMLIAKPSGLSSFQSSELKAFAASERPTIMIAMLQEIKGVSKAAAQRIAAGFTVQQLCNRNPAIEQLIANIKITDGGRRLGDALAARIIESLSDPVAKSMSDPIVKPMSDPIVKSETSSDSAKNTSAVME